jgi:hypothetical protein
MADGHTTTPQIPWSTAPLNQECLHALYWATYGAAVVRQVFDHMARGNNGPDEADMDGFVEEAETVACMAVEAAVRKSAA